MIAAALILAAFGALAALVLAASGGRPLPGFDRHGRSHGEPRDRVDRVRQAGRDYITSGVLPRWD